MLIMLAEDDDDTAGFVDDGLTALGHIVTVAPTGAEALAYVAAMAFDVVILDRMMPDDDGMAVLAACPF